MLSRAALEAISSPLARNRTKNPPPEMPIGFYSCRQTARRRPPTAYPPWRRTLATVAVGSMAPPARHDGAPQIPPPIRLSPGRPAARAAAAPEPLPQSRCPRAAAPEPQPQPKPKPNGSAPGFGSSQLKNNRPINARLPKQLRHRINAYVKRHPLLTAGSETSLVPATRPHIPSNGWLPANATRLY